MLNVRWMIGWANPTFEILIRNLPSCQLYNTRYLFGSLRSFLHSKETCQWNAAKQNNRNRLKIINGFQNFYISTSHYLFWMGNPFAGWHAINSIQADTIVKQVNAEFVKRPLQQLPR